MVDVVTETPETLFNDDFPELESLSDEARILCVDRNTDTNLMEWYQAPLSLLKWDKWDKWDTWAKWEPWERWPRGYQWETWDKWDKWDKWDTWEKWPKWDPWQDGQNGLPWEQWPQGLTWNWIAGMTTSKSGKATTVTFNYTQWGSDSFVVMDWEDWGGGWWGGDGDVKWPASSTDSDIVLFNGTTWKTIKDSGKKLSDLQSKLVSGTNIKTINSQSLLWSWNIDITWAGGDVTWPSGAVNECIAVFDGTTGKAIKDSQVKVATINTQTFSLSSTSDLTNASKAYAWYALWKTPFILYNGEVYSFHGYSDSTMTFYTIPSGIETVSNSISALKLKWLSIAISWGSATSITATWGQIVKYLDTNIDYSSPYTPTYNGSPATKKYVDDHDTVVSGDSGVTYTIKVSNSDPTSWTASNIITLVL